MSRTLCKFQTLSHEVCLNILSQKVQGRVSQTLCESRTLFCESCLSILSKKFMKELAKLYTSFELSHEVCLNILSQKFQRRVSRTLMWDHVPVDGLISEHIDNLPRDSFIVDSSDDFLALFRPVHEEVIEICTTTKTSINTNIKYL